MVVAVSMHQLRLLEFDVQGLKLTSRALMMAIRGRSSLPRQAFSYSRINLSFVQYSAPVELERCVRKLDSI